MKPITKMQTTRELSVEDLGPADDRPGRKVLVTLIWYEKGGLNYLSGDQNPRGYYLVVRPETRYEDGTTSFILFRGTKSLLEPATRFSPKRLAEIEAPAEKAAALRAKVLVEDVKA